MEVSEMEERKIGQIKEELKAATEAMLPSFIMAYESDERSGVIKLVEQAKKRLQKDVYKRQDMDCSVRMQEILP